MYEVSFYSVDLLNAIYNFLHRVFGNEIILYGNAIVFKIIEHNSQVLIFNDFISISKK